MGKGTGIMRVGGITDMSTIDWYGNVSLVLFYAGCNMRCPYCQNSELIPIDSGEAVGLEYLRERLEMSMRPVPQLDAVVFSGGEPLLQPDAVIDAGRLVKNYGLKLMLDTNGTLSDSLVKVLKEGLVDRVALDVKAPFNPYQYGLVSGLTEKGSILSQETKRSLDYCNVFGVEVEVRTTVAPGLSDSPDFIASLAQDIKDKCVVYYLQQFDNQGDVLDSTLKHREVPRKGDLVRLAHIAKSAGIDPVYIKTRKEGLERIK
jgi:pyruvate formate lyase activating enzyme